ncbi:NHLP family bacteriocin export ABC transporter peptidase/permease/ATPase subunit [Gemmatimonas groenlandica]|uniref:NHLP family bacteriocin export ABC transporter peptidase/permease/ATPase subunit n=1 Tax=Gemmatimonas groenlandica TaxID=2732249 RepID=A0A6M4IMP1_9BACT|nr:NHLP family bacteriocin export ABC transporter peptidase/permease/ATPase subunit [Gemmatimonas groenlandica]QJR35355.1 NHLP family bacteriocin export ABC transporter peptidase/permease/ATPase subunit [Gemmatimonas groenlandica]
MLARIRTNIATSRRVWRRVTQRPSRTRTVLQMEAVECGAACLGSILGFYGCYAPLEELRVACGVSRDGVTAKNILRAARTYGLEAKGFKRELDGLRTTEMPCVLFWNFNHFVVLEGIVDDVAYLNDPATGPRRVSMQEVDEAYTGVVLCFTPGPQFERVGAEPSLRTAVRDRVRGAQGPLAFAMLAGLALVLPGLLVPAFARLFVDHVLVQSLQGWVAPLLLGMALTAALRGALVWLRSYVLLRLGARLSIVETSRFLWHVLRLPVEFFAQRSAGDISSRVALNTSVTQMLTGQVASTAIDLLLAVFYAVLMWLYDWQLALISVAIVAANLWLMRLVSATRVDGNRRLLQQEGKFVGALMGGLGNIETLKATSGEAQFFATLAGHQATLTNTSQALARQSLVLSSVPSILGGIGSAAVLALGGLHVMNGTLTLGMLVAFQSLQAGFFGPVQSLLSLGAQLQNVVGELSRVDDVLRYPLDTQTRSEIAPPGTRVDLRVVDLRQTQLHSAAARPELSGHVELDNITFGYSRLAPPLLRDFSLTLKPGARIALVGASGCGKSTVSKLVCGLYQPWGGEIYFDGQPIREIERELFSASVALVDQDLRLFSGTIREALTLWDETIPDRHVLQAARDARIDDVITMRPGAFDSELQEGGANLSGGQRQRLEIARALCINPRVLVLDEATSALDTVTEAAIDRNIRRRGCTCLIVAHRLSTVRDCDEILVLDRGAVVQRGTHDELIDDRNGHYARLLEVSAHAAVS